MNLQKGKTYRGRMIVASVVFEILPKHVIPKLEDVGFTDVKVYLSQDELPNDWPEDKRTDVSDLGETQVWAEGVWNGDVGAHVPEGGDQWKVYDIWEKGGGGESVSYGKKQTKVSQAITVAGWGLGLFLFGLPVILLAVSENKR